MKNTLTLIAVIAAAAALMAFRPAAEAPISGAGSNNQTTYSDSAARFFDVRDYGIIANDPAEERNNSIKMDTLMARLYRARGGTIYFPERGIYYVHCTIPQNVMPKGNFVPLPIKLKGGVPPFLAIGSMVGGFTRPNAEWTIIRTTSATTPALSTNSAALSNSWLVVVEDLEFQSTNSADYCVDLQGAAQAEFRGEVLISNGTWGNTGSWPMATVGLNMPPTNNGGLNSINNMAIVGFYVGIRPGEHMTANHLMTYFNNFGIEHNSNHHGNLIQRYQCAHNKYDVYVHSTDGLPVQLTINQFDFETGPNTIANVYDPAGLLVGNMQWISVKAGHGIWNNFVVHGTNPANFKAAQIGKNFQDFTSRGTLMAGGKRYIPTTNVERWGQSYGSDIWYSFASSCEIGATSSGANKLAAGQNGWIAQQYVSTSCGAFVGLKAGSGQAIGFSVGPEGTIIVEDGSGASVNSSVKAVDGSFYRLNRVSGKYSIESSSNGGTSWSSVYAISNPFGGSAPDGGYSAFMKQGALTTQTHKAGPVYYPQGSF